DLLDMFPEKSSKEREKLITKKYGSVFVIGIGHPLSSGKPHDLRASDYDDWSTQTGEKTFGLNGDILVWDDVRKDVLEISSMGIRVDKQALIKQAKLMSQEHILTQEFHSKILDDTMPLSIGGGIGQSRLCMFFLKKAHIGEVQSSAWPTKISLPIL
ncbi:MAG: aspartate--ammonia ligase, partial [bacterium]